MRSIVASLVVALVTAVSGYAGPQGGENAGKTALASIDGRVLDLAGSPLRKVAVTADPQQTGTSQAGRSSFCSTDADGRFTLVNLEPGGYHLTFDRPGFIRNVFGSETAGENGALINLTAGQHLAGVEVRLTPEATISGRVVDQDRDPIPGAFVRLFSYRFDLGVRQPRMFAQADADRTGAFRLTGIGPGQYYIIATPQKGIAESSTLPSGERVEYAYLPTYYPGSPEAAGAQAISIGPGDGSVIGDLTLRKARTVHVRGRVNSDAFPGDAGRLAVRAFPDDPLSAVTLFEAPSSAVSPKDGTFDLAGVPAGRYELIVTARTGQIQALGRQSIVVGETDVENIVISLLPGAEIAGSVVYAGSPSGLSSPQAGGTAGPTVVLWSAGPGSINKFAQRVRDSSFRFRDVPPGRYMVRVTERPDDVYLQSIRSRDGGDLLATELDLTQGGGHREITVTLNLSPARVDGSVLDGDGHPLPRKVVTLAPSPPDNTQAHRYRRTVSDEAGRFVLGGLPPGDYCLYAWHELPETAQFDGELLVREAGRCTKIQLQEGGKESVQLTLHASGGREQ